MPQHLPQLKSRIGANVNEQARTVCAADARISWGFLNGVRHARTGVRRPPSPPPTKVLILQDNTSLRAAISGDTPGGCRDGESDGAEETKSGGYPSLSGSNSLPTTFVVRGPSAIAARSTMNFISFPVVSIALGRRDGSAPERRSRVRFRPRRRRREGLNATLAWPISWKSRSHVRGDHVSASTTRRWLRAKASQASRYPSRELNSCSRPSSDDLWV
jgi:hypothetical protein